MDRRERTRLLLAVAAAAGAAALAVLLPLTAPMLAALAAGLAAWLAGRPDPLPPSPAAPPGGERAAARAEPGLAAVAASIDEPLLFVERQQVTHANAAAIALLGAHIVGEDVRLAIRHPAAAARLAAAGDVGGDVVGSPPVELAGLGGSSRHWEMIVHMIGRGGLLVRLADRTEARAAERMRVDFVANASHELRTPLATLLGYIETLEVANGAGEATTRLRFLATMMGEARRMQRLIDDLMSLSRIEAERHSAPQAAVALEALVREVADSIVVAQGLDPARIVIDAAADLPVITGDRAQLSQLLHNLIGNALKYGRSDTPVRVEIAHVGAMARLAVADEGAGIARVHLPRLTERFYRVDPGRSRAIGGTGLGLAIVKHIVERHRGRLEIESEVGVGTTVVVLLPAAPPPPLSPLSSNRHANVTEVAPNDPIEQPSGAHAPVPPEAP